MARRKQHDDIPPGAPACAYRGCGQPASHKAPKSRENLREYQWLCLDHVREYNKAWDFFSGLSRDEIEHFMKDALTGHRPTWKISQKTAAPYSTEMLEEALGNMLNGARRRKAAGPPVTDKQRKAFAVMEVEPPQSLKTLKAQYKVLVKKYHPDVNRDDKKAEERFKSITLSYRYLMDTYITQKQ